MLYHMISGDDDHKDDDDDIQQKDIEKFKELTKSSTDTGKNDGEPVNSSIFYLYNKEADILRKKIKFVSKMMMMQKTLREQNEAVV